MSTQKSFPNLITSHSIILTQLYCDPGFTYPHIARIESNIYFGPILLPDLGYIRRENMIERKISEVIDEGFTEEEKSKIIETIDKGNQKQYICFDVSSMPKVKKKPPSETTLMWILENMNSDNKIVRKVKIDTKSTVNKGIRSLVKLQKTKHRAAVWRVDNTNIAPLEILDLALETLKNTWNVYPPTLMPNILTLQIAKLRYEQIKTT